MVEFSLSLSVLRLQPYLGSERVRCESVSAAGTHLSPQAQDRLDTTHQGDNTAPEHSTYRLHTTQLSAVPVHSVLRLLSVMLTSMITSQGLIGGM